MHLPLCPRGCFAMWRHFQSGIHDVISLAAGNSKNGARRDPLRVFPVPCFIFDEIFTVFRSRNDVLRQNTGLTNSWSNATWRKK
jgi:hypothetical protein